MNLYEYVSFNRDIDSNSLRKSCLYKTLLYMLHVTITICGVFVDFMFVYCSITDVEHVDGLVQDCSISRASAMEILLSFTKPLMYYASFSGHVK